MLARKRAGLLQFIHMHRKRLEVISQQSTLRSNLATLLKDIHLAAMNLCGFESHIRSRCAAIACQQNDSIARTF